MKNLLLIKCAKHNTPISVFDRRHGVVILTAAAMAFCTLSEMAWSFENYSVGSPIGPSTLPPSSIRSGLIRSYNPIDSSGNLIITGNVAGSSYFRGTVPYRSTTGLWAPLGSSSLDPFLRDSTRSDDFDRYFERYRVQPYYSPTGTVTTTTPGRSGVFAPSTRINERAPDTFGLEDVPKKEVSPAQSVSVSDMRLLPTPLSTQQIEKPGSEKVTSYPISGGVTPEQYQERMEQLRLELQQLKTKTEELKQNLGEKDKSLQTTTKLELSEGVSQQLKEPGAVETLTPTLQRQTQEPPAPEPTAPSQEQPNKVWNAEEDRVWSPETYERIKKQLDNLQTSQPKEKTSAVTEKDSEPTYGEPAAEKQSSKDKSYFEILRKGQMRTEDTSSRTLNVTGEEESYGKKSSALEEVRRLSSSELSAEARRIMGPHKTIESFSEAKYNQYILAADTYLKQGKYYKAADSYALASIYKKDNAAAYAGKGHALFAAGEYISSALFISRAVEASAAYAKAKVDLAALLGGDRDKLESRIADVEEWVKRSDSAELGFLLGYVYYRIDKLDRAKEAIDAAYAKRPQWPALQALKKAIDEAIAAPK